MLVLLFGEFEASSHQILRRFRCFLWLDESGNRGGIAIWRDFLAQENPDRYFQHFLNISGREVHLSQFYCRYFQRFVQPVWHAELICWKRVYIYKNYTSTHPIKEKVPDYIWIFIMYSMIILWLIFWSGAFTCPSLNRLNSKQLGCGSSIWSSPCSIRWTKVGTTWRWRPLECGAGWCHITPTPQPILFVMIGIMIAWYGLSHVAVCTGGIFCGSFCEDHADELYFFISLLVRGARWVYTMHSRTMRIEFTRWMRITAISYMSCDKGAVCGGFCCER